MLAGAEFVPSMIEEDGLLACEDLLELIMMCAQLAKVQDFAILEFIFWAAPTSERFSFLTGCSSCRGQSQGLIMF